MVSLTLKRIRRSSSILSRVINLNTVYILGKKGQLNVTHPLICKIYALLLALSTLNFFLGSSSTLLLLLHNIFIYVTETLKLLFLHIGFLMRTPPEAHFSTNDFCHLFFFFFFKRSELDYSRDDAPNDSRI